MFDIGWTELLVIGVVALIVVGPKDLPGMFRTLGRFTAKARGMAKEFTKAMEEAADETGVKEMSKSLKDMASSKGLGLDKLEGAASKFEKWDPMKKSSAAKGPATAALSEERAASAEKMRDAAAKKATDRVATEKAKAAGTATSTKKDVPKKAKAKPVTAKKPAAKKPATEKPAAQKTAAKATTAKKAAPKKAAAKKTVKKKTT